MQFSTLSASKRIKGFLQLSIAVGLSTLVGGYGGYRFEHEKSGRQLALDVRMRSELLRSELERHRLLPAALAGDPSLSSVTNVPPLDLTGNPPLQLLNKRLANLSQYDGAATLYLIGADGITRAASNYLSDRSFVGQDYSARSYFRDAMREGFGQLFATGTVSGIPGLYLAQKLAAGNGVLVVKIEFSALEQGWTRPDELTTVSASDGQVLLTSDSALRYGHLVPKLPAGSVTSTYGIENGWTVRIDRSIRRALIQSVAVGAALGALGSALLLIVLGRLRLRQIERARVQAALTQEVARRTAELREANELLRREIEERNRSESQIQRLRTDLINANKLAVLGQISAGVAHEINQPVAAIRNYVDNAKVFVQRGQLSDANENLNAVASLTERIGVITRELRSFSRPEPEEPEPVRLVDVIDGALSLIRPLLRDAGVDLVREDSETPIVVYANRIRLEQVLMNLLQNASEAVAGREGAKVLVRSGPSDGGGWIEIADNGPGVPSGQLEQLFEPFATTKPNGLGLGLVISRDILANYRGSLTYRRSLLGGACFHIQLGI